MIVAGRLELADSPDEADTPKPPPEPRSILSGVRLAILLGRKAAAPTAAPAPPKPPVERLRRAVRRLRAVRKFASRDAILRKIRAGAGAGAGGGASLASLRALLASDLPMEELVRLSFQPAALAQEVRARGLYIDIKIYIKIYKDKTPINRGPREGSCIFARARARSVGTVSARHDPLCTTVHSQARP